MLPSWALCIFVAFCAVFGVDGQCSVSNGGCSHICLDRGDSMVTCSCPCLMTLVDQFNCEAIDSCDVDLYFLGDLSSLIDPGACLFINLPFLNPVYVEWPFWRNHVADVEEFFVTENSGSRWNVGVQYFSTRTNYETANTYSNTDLQPVVTQLRARQTPICAGDIYYSFFLGSAIENNPVFTNHQYLGPGTRRPAVNTTYIAVAVIFGPSPIDDADLALRLSSIMEGMDQVIVVSRNQSLDRTRNEQINRLTACNSTTAFPCDNYFYVDAVNDNGFSLTKANLMSVMNLDACLARRISANPITTSISCGNSIVFTIPKCLLQGLLITDLTLNDGVCGVDAVDTGADIVVTIPFIGCGMQTMPDNIGDIVFTQVIRTKIFSANQVLPTVAFPAVCSYAENVVSPSSPSPVKIGDVFDIGSAFFGLTMSLESVDSGLALSSGAMVPVNCPVALRASTTIPVGYTLKAVECYATSSADGPPLYSLITNGCPVDSTVTVSPSSGEEFLFQFKFFEFYSTYKSPKEAKLPVYLCCRYTACGVNDNRQICTVPCSSRKKRYVDAEEGQAVTRTIGPFQVDGKKEEANENEIEFVVRQTSSTSVTDVMMIIFSLTILAVIVVVMKAKSGKQLEEGPSFTETMVQDFPPKYDFQAIGVDHQGQSEI